VEELASRVQGEMVPLGATFAYFPVVPLSEDELKQFLQEPIAALPPAICGALPRVGILLAPYLERGNGKTGDLVSFDKPPEARQIYASRLVGPDSVTLAFAVKDEDLANYHYSFYNAIAALIAGQEGGAAQERYYARLREELAQEVHGEVDERSWHLKQVLLRRSKNVRKETKPFRAYARQSLEDTLTLYLHGICCDIDVETGPRQMPSRYLRKRLEMLISLFPPPEGYAALPEYPARR